MLFALFAFVVLPVTATAQTPVADRQPTIAGNAWEFVPDTDNGRLEVIAVGAFDPMYGHIPVIVQNNTNDAVSNAVAKVEIKDANGKLIAVGQSSTIFGLSPSLLNPGDIAMGYIDVEGEVAGRYEYVYSVTASPTDDFMAEMMIDVAFGEVTWITDRIVGEVVNPTDRAVTGVSLTIMCFDQDGAPLFASVESLTETIPAQSSTTFQANGLFRDLADCERFLIAGTGVAVV